MCPPTPPRRQKWTPLSHLLNFPSLRHTCLFLVAFFYLPHFIFHIFPHMGVLQTSTTLHPSSSTATLFTISLITRVNFFHGRTWIKKKISTIENKIIAVFYNHYNCYMMQKKTASSPCIDFSVQVKSKRIRSWLGTRMYKSVRDLTHLLISCTRERGRGCKSIFVLKSFPCGLWPLAPVAPSVGFLAANQCSHFLIAKWENGLSIMFLQDTEWKLQLSNPLGLASQV